MPKKGFRKNAYVSLACTDIKLSDFADGHVSTVRRKPAVNSLAREVKSLCSLERTWFEEEVFLNGTDESESETSDAHVKKKNKHKSRQHATKSDSGGKTYPLDLWFLLSEYIKPEDVKVFACLCKSSYLVCQTYTFWIRLYKRYYKTGQQLPNRLQPHRIERPYCLKACVVRALYHFYPEFSKKITNPTSTDICNLLKFVCVSMWRLQKNGKWLFCFKFRSQFANSLPVESREQNNDDDRLWTVWDACDYTGPQVLLKDVNANPEEGCKVLQVTCPNFIAAPVVMGGHLADVRVTLARDMIKQKLQLTFSFSSYKQTRRNMPSLGSRDCGGSGEILEFEPVESMTILDWWHPQYPTFAR